MDLVIAITILYLILVFLISRIPQNSDLGISLAISAAKTGVRFPCRFVKNFYGYHLSEFERKCIKEITKCEGDCEECLEM
ncbi:MAG: hypothetical protein QXW74_00905 [Archaeoglobaceae archaeon]